MLPTAMQGVGKTSTAMVNRNGRYRLTLETYEFRKSNHLCFRCGEKYGPGHICKVRQLNYLTGFIKGDKEGDQVSELDENENITIEGVVEQEVQQAVCLNALTGHNIGENTILVGGTVKKRHLAILIDSGSTHSFIDKHTLAASGYKPQLCSPVRVTVADGNYVMCNSHCRGFCGKCRKEFSWTICSLFLWEAVLWCWETTG